MAWVFKPAGSKKYVIVYRDGTRRRKRVGTTDKAVTQRIANKIEEQLALRRDGLNDPRDEAFRDHGDIPLADHLNDWYRDMIAKGKTQKHATLSRDRASKLIAMVKGVSIDELIPGREADAMEEAAKKLASTLRESRFDDLSPESIQAALATMKHEGRSAQSCNHAFAALRAFLRWCHDRGRVRQVATRGIALFNVDTDRRHIRRSLTDQELGALIRSTQSGPSRFRMSCPLRAIAYRTAAFTGLRVDELRSLTPESFHLDGPRPYIALAASASKDRRPVDQPIPPALVAPLRDWIADKAPGERIFPLHSHTAKLMGRDLKAAGIPYETSEGVADFQSLRGCCVSALIKTGRSISEVQALARHKKPETTLKHYAKVSGFDLHNAVANLGATAGATKTGHYASKPKRKQQLG